MDNTLDGDDLIPTRNNIEGNDDGNNGTNSIGEESNSSEYKNESEEGSIVDEEENVSEDDSSQDVETLLEKVLECNVLHHYVGSFAVCQPGGGLREEDYPPADIQLEVVQYLLELAPDAVNKVDDGETFYFVAHPRGHGALPLHIACFNADCSASIIKLLLQKNPAASGTLWECKYRYINHGLPLHNYLERAFYHGQDAYEDENLGWIEEMPSFPGGELDYVIIQMLVNSYPQALTQSSPNLGTPIKMLCECEGVTLELAKLLVDDDCACFNGDTTFKKRFMSPMWSILGNDLISTELFQYLLKSDPDSLKTGMPLVHNIADDDEDDHWYGQRQRSTLQNETHIHLACSNQNVKADIVRQIVEAQPEMLKVEYDGCLPLHTLCNNGELDEQEAISILRILVTAYPEAVKKRVGKVYMSDLMPGDEGKYPIRLAEESGMSFGFCKALLSERAKLSSIPEASVLQVTLIYKCKLDTIQKLVEDDRELLLREDGEGHIILYTARMQHTSLDVVQYLVNGIKTLLSEGAKLSSMPGANVLHIVCAYKCQLGIIKKVVEDDPKLLLMTDEKGRIPLHLAVRYGASTNLVRYLVKSDCMSVLKRDEEGNLPLHVAANFSSLDIVQYLVEGFKSSITDKFSGDMLVERLKLANEISELNLQFPNYNGDHPLHKACRRGNFKVVEYLMTKSSVSVATNNFFGQLPIHLLCDKNEEYKSPRRVQSVEYTECIFKMLTAFPELCNVGV